MTCSCKWDGAVWKWDCALNEIITEMRMEMRFHFGNGKEAIKHSRHRFCLNFIVHQQEEGKFQKTKLRDSKGRKKKVETHVRRPKFGKFDSFKKVLFELLSLWLFMLTIVWNVCPPSFEVRLFCIFFCAWVSQFRIRDPLISISSTWVNLCDLTPVPFHSPLSQLELFRGKDRDDVDIVVKGGKKKEERKNHTFTPWKGECAFHKGKSCSIDLV